MFIELSGNCIGRCPICFSKSKENFDIDVFQTILKDGFDAGFNWVGFCGKDPFQHQKSPEIISLALKIGYSVRIYSSLLLYDYDPIIFADFHSRLDVTFTVWGLPDVHDSYCGIKGAFKASCLKLLTWRNAGARVAAKYFPNEMSKCNINELRQIFIELGIPLFICVWWSPFEFNQTQTDFKPLSVKKAVGILKAQNQIIKYSYDLQKSPCKAGFQRVFISSDFSIKACSVNEKVIADLTKERFIDIWKQNSCWGKWRSVKLKELKECRNCQYQEFCHICPSPYIENKLSICNKGKLEWAKSMYESVNGSTNY